MSEIFCEDVKQRRWWRTWGIWGFVVVLLGTLVGGIVYASHGSADPTAAPASESHAVVVANSAIIVFREGLEAVLILAAVTAPLLGSQRRLRKPIGGGVAVAFAAVVATWFVAQAILSQFSRYGDKLQAVTGLIAIGVLLVIMNWFFHKLYWTKWIGSRTAKRKAVGAQVLGLVVLGFTSVYREGFEVVLFLQSLQLKAGTPTVLEGVGIGLAGTVAVGVATFFLQQKLPYKRMLVVTGVLLGVVLVVMVGGSARTLVDVGWLPAAPMSVQFPDWWARWFELVPSWTTVAAQLLAAVTVVGSYFVAEWIKVRAPRRRGREAAQRSTAPVSL
ncbi:MAG: FTR1 family protein [Actinomycetota bacterium]